MNSGIKGLLIFTFGAAVGYSVAWCFTKNKYERIAQEEIDSVKSTFRKKERELLELNKHKPDLTLYKDLLDNYRYLGEVARGEREADPEVVKKATIDLNTKIEEYEEDDAPQANAMEDQEAEYFKNEEDEDNIMEIYKAPYVITPSEFNTYDDYEAESLNYFADGVLADIFGEVIDKDAVEDLVGDDPFSHFGEYEIDTVYVRNEGRKIDYEILRDSNKYSDLYGDDE